MAQKTGSPVTKDTKSALQNNLSKRIDGIKKDLKLKDAKAEAIKKPQLLKQH